MKNLAILGTKHKDGFEPYWQDEKDWLCIVEFLPTDNPEARLFAADTIGYLVGYANLTNTRSLALLGDPDASAYELLFSFSSPEEKNEFQALCRIPVCRPHGSDGASRGRSQPDIRLTALRFSPRWTQTQLRESSMGNECSLRFVQSCGRSHSYELLSKRSRCPLRVEE